ncbi:MAG: rhomboid family intramembrane serine protease [Bdellovibrionota bacterium]
MFRLHRARLQTYPITHLLVGINILFYLFICSQAEKSFLGVLFDGPGYDALLSFGAKENGLIALGQWYRLFLPMFIHANFVHLIVNMVGLWSVAQIFESIAGSKKLFLLYVISGITGNFCSFALLRHLSVGASGSLFGILLCLYIIQKYQERLNKNFKTKSPQYQFGNIILINGILNILFGITFPIFDWACHLGGAIAGVLFGFALVTQHSWKMRLLAHVTNNLESYTNFNKLNKKFFEKHIIYYIGLLLINISFSLGIFKIEKYQKIAGMGAYLAAENPTAPLGYDDLNQYKELLVTKNKETNPNNLLYGAFYIAQNKQFYASYKVFSVLIDLSKHNFASGTVEKQKYDQLLEQGLLFAKKNSSLENSFLPPGFVPSMRYENAEDYCAKPANLFMTLGFFEIAGNLYECAYMLNDKNDSYALKSFEAFHKIKDEQGMSQLLTLVKSLSN